MDATREQVTEAMVADDIMPAVRQVLADFAHNNRNASIWALEAKIQSAIEAALSPSPTGGEAGAQNELGTFDRIGKQTASELLVATIKHSARIQERLRAENERLTAELDDWKANYYGDTKMFERRALAAEARAEKAVEELERMRLPEGTLGQHGSVITVEFYSAEYAARAFDAIEYAMSLEPASLPKESADG